MMRLARYLATAGVASRRKAETLIAAGDVRVNGVTVREMGTVVEPGRDRIEFRGRPVISPSAHSYFVLNKPPGVVTTMHDPEGRRTVAEVVRARGVMGRFVPVGRLDYDTAGVLLLTDDGALAHILTHPRFGVEKTYRATLRGRLTSDDVAKLGAGMALADGPAAPAVVRVVAAGRSRSTVDITIHEGRNRQVRRMFEQLEHPVLGLVRMRFGPLTLGTLAPGELREAADREVRALQAILAAAS